MGTFACCRRVLTTVSCVGVAIQGVFFAEYNVNGFENQDHVFSGIRREAKVAWDRQVYGIDTSSAPQTQQQAPKTDK